MLPNEAYQEFKEIYLRLLNVELDFDEAKTKADNLITLYEFLCSPSDSKAENNNENE